MGVYFSCLVMSYSLWSHGLQEPPGSSMEFSRSELPFPSPGDHPDTGIEPRSPGLQEDTLLPEPPAKPYTPGKFDQQMLLV